MQEVGLLQATLDGIGEADNEIGGFRQTRVTAFTEAAQSAPDTFEWSGGSLVSYGRNPTEMSILPWIKLDSDGRLFKVTAVTPLGGGDYEVEVDLGTAVAPVTDKSAVPGTVFFFASGTTITIGNPEFVPAGGWLRAVGSDNWFQVIAVDGSTGTIANPHGLTVPTGVQSVEYSPNPTVSIVTDAIDVESVLNWPDGGYVAIGAVLYRYTSISLAPMQLQGITYFDAGAEILGLKRNHSIGDVVTDVTRQFSALEQTRNAMLVDYATGEDLNALGRNYGVLRYPFLQSDDVFREIVKALAYNPRGTMFGLELALDAMVGPGNYELYEDLVNSPCTVFVRLLGDAALEDRATGKAYLTGQEAVDPTTTTSLDISGTVINRGTVYSVRLKDHVHDGDFRNVKPSGLQIEDIAGSPVTAWTYEGTSGATEGANVILTPDYGIRFSHPAGGVSRYYGIRRLAKEYSDWSVDCVMRIPASATLSTAPGDLSQWAVQVLDGVNFIGWGCYQNSGTPTTIHILLASGTSSVGAIYSLTKDVWYAVQIRKRGESVELWVDGNLVDVRNRAAFGVATSQYRIRFGIHREAAPTTVFGDMLQLSHRVYTPTFDYWNLYHETATLIASKQIQIATSEFEAGDVGKRIETYNSGVVNPYGGNNNGKFEVETFTDVNNVEVRGILQEGAASPVGSTQPLRIVVDPRKQQFVFPDDLGKQIVLSGSSQGNDGTYTIEKLRDPDTLDDLAADFATPLRTVTNICEIEEPVPSFSFIAEAAIDYRLNPVFVAESNMYFTLSSAGSESGGTLTLREALPGSAFICDVWYNEVLSALVLLDFSVKNEIVQVLPELLWHYYPFYLSDPLGFVRAYLDDITAAGVIPEYFVE